MMPKYTKEKRVNRIIELVGQSNQVTISDLASYFSVSHMTIRRDVENLQQDGMVKVIFGGQIVKNFIEKSPEYKNKSKENIESKKKIALQAYKLLVPGQTIFMDGGTTVKQLAHLIDMRLTIFTNDISTAFLFRENADVKLILCPGEMVRESLSAYSSETLRFLSDRYFDFSFIGADGFNKEHGAMTTSQVKADCKWMALHKSAQSVLMVDDSKENIFCTYKIADLNDFNYIFTGDT